MSATATEAETISPTPATVLPVPWPPSRLYRLSVAQYEAMIQHGVLTKYDRVELIEGLLVEKMTKNWPHITATWLIQQALGAALPAGCFLAHEIPVLLARSEPEPDFMVMRGHVPDYFGRKPAPADVALLVEVSDSSLDEDRARAPLFAEAGLAVYWIANVPDRRIEVYSDPDGSEYRTRRDYAMDEQVPVVLDGREVARLAVRDLLPPREGD